MENKGNFIDEAENPGGNDWDMKNLFFILFFLNGRTSPFFFCFSNNSVSSTCFPYNESVRKVVILAIMSTS